MLFKRSIRTQVLTSIGASLLWVMLSVPLCVYFFTNVLSEPTWFTGGPGTSGRWWAGVVTGSEVVQPCVIRATGAFARMH